MRHRRRQNGGPQPTPLLHARRTARALPPPAQAWWLSDPHADKHFNFRPSHEPSSPNPVPARRELPTGVRQRPGHGSSQAGAGGVRLAGWPSPSTGDEVPRFCNGALPGLPSALRAPAEPGRAPRKKAEVQGASIPSNFRALCSGTENREFSTPRTPFCSPIRSTTACVRTTAAPSFPHDAGRTATDKNGTAPPASSLTAPAWRPTLFGWRDACFRPA